MIQWHREATENVLTKLETNSENGLNTKQVQKRTLKYGTNEFIEKGKKSAFQILLDQLKEVMVIILLIAAFITGMILHEYIDATVIMIIVVLNTALGFWQESKAEKAMAALKKLTVPFVKVRRNGRVQEISSKGLVPGDIILLEAGNIIPADARIITAANLQVQEATLTGESQPVEKNADFIAEKELSIADTKNMVYMGTMITFGRAEAVVTETGMNTQLGKIATMLQDIKEEKTPLQKRLAKLGVVLSMCAAFLILVVVSISLFQSIKGRALEEVFFTDIIKATFLTAISMAVAAIPEGLPAIVTIALALGARKMLKRHSLIRNLPSVETLGSITVICSDKTGTLTQNKMSVSQVALPGKEISMDKVVKNFRKTRDKTISLLLACGALCNDAEVTSKNGKYKIIGDPTEGSLVVTALKIKLPKENLLKALPRVSELPFSSERKRMTTVHKIAAETPLVRNLRNLLNKNILTHVAFTKGSVDGLMEICTKIVIDNRIENLTPQLKEQILTQNKKMAQNGIRVLGITCKPVRESAISDFTNMEKELIYIGMIGMTDPVRPEIKKSVRTCKQAGIRPIMITGDHPLTALYIAKSIGIAANDSHLTGEELSRMSIKELEKVVAEVSVYARVNPEHKMKLVDALQSRGEIVAMTGDGVNDAPALKSADIGVAMGITGTDVAKQSSDMVLLDDNFSTIVAAVKAGRTIYENIKRFIKYILTGNAGEIMVMLFGPFLGIPLPLYPLQILWINLVTDGAPGVAMSYELPEKDTMQRPPARPKESVFSHGAGRQILWVGALVALLSLGAGLLYLPFVSNLNIVRTMIFSTLTFCQMTLALCVRSNKTSIFRLKFFSNPMLIFAVTSTFLLQLMLIYVPSFQDIFKTVALTPLQLAVCFLMSFFIIAGVEIEKLILRMIKKSKV